MSEAVGYIRQFSESEITVPTINVDWVNRFNSSEVKKVLHWAKHISFQSLNDLNVSNLFRLTTTSNDALNVQPLNWVLYLKETQVTDTVSNFLNEGPQEIQSARVKAYLSIFGIELDKYEGDFFVKSEYGVPGGRIDLLIGWGKRKGSNFQYGLVCEFKIDSAISDGQLSKYESWAIDHIDNPHYAFISRKYKSADIAALIESSQKWHCRLWWKFLRDWEQGISEENDSESFRLFRSTLWDQVT